MGAPTIGIDTGGTFTDLVCAGVTEPHRTAGAEVCVVKVPSTPEDPGRAIVAGLADLASRARWARRSSRAHVVHGTTVALNALLVGRTAKIALVTNAGFRDLVEIGRQDRPEIYALHPQKPAPLVARELRFEVPQRSWPRADGGGLEEVRAPSPAELAHLVDEVRASGAESIAVCLLHSYADPSIEERVARALEGLGLPITRSSALLAEHREFERFSTALVNAALVPLMGEYLSGLAPRLGGARLSLLQSSGGTLEAARAAVEPVRVLLSGPAGGVIGARLAAREAGIGDFVGLDMGGTSTDVAFQRAAGHGEERRATRALEPVRIAGHPVAVPTLDIHTIGCGGGSLVRVDAGGVLHVGPESAGAAPGPVAYGKSDVPTVTDAHVLLGHVAEGPFLQGNLALDHGAVRRAFDAVGARLGVSATAAARGVLDVARAAMRRAIGVMTMQRGEDPERLVLVAFGGAGGLSAAALAESLGLRAALVPLHPGALSARGMTFARGAGEQVRTILEPLAAWNRRRRTEVFEVLAERGRDELAGAARRDVLIELALDLRYRGQSFELRVPESSDPAGAFHAAHERLYGYALLDREIELVCLRAGARVREPLAERPSLRAQRLAREALRGEREAWFERRVRARIIDRSALEPGMSFDGPALVEEYSGTTLVPPDWRASVTHGGHLLLRAARRRA